MGEVYRADDLKLGHSMALKFLPESLAKDTDRLAYLHREVRLARQVSHPNVCRVYDIAEVDGEHFLSMEYIDGEDLASLLRRIGRLPSEKGVRIAHGLCAALAAAHDKGVLHRDLKPANIMIDGRGHPRITDFGLAKLADDMGRRNTGAGTPAYMAPEQLAGKPATAQSDLYALGLVLYEMFTGQRPFEAGTRAESLQRQADSTPSAPSNVVSDIDPAVERVILRCLETEPTNRPASALSVAAALPGGDPLAAALAAGETPAPEMVAAAGGDGGLRPGVAVACLAGVALGLALVTFTSGDATLIGQVGLELKPDVLEQRARDVVKQLGYHDPAKPGADSAHGFHFNVEYLQYAEQQGRSLAEDGPPAITFWYRQSPELLTPIRFRERSEFNWARGRVTEDDPPESAPGMISMRLDGQGRLIQFLAVPIPEEEIVEQSDPVDWEGIYDLAGLPMERFAATEASRTPPIFVQSQMAWKGSRVYKDAPDDEITVEGGVSNGRVAYFHVRGPWTTSSLTQAANNQMRVMAIFITWITVVPGALLLAIYNIRQRRVDWPGARRLCTFIFCLFMLRWLVEASHRVALLHEFDLLILALAASLQAALEYALYYVAIEPNVRRLWPESLISWSRVLAGRIRDPLVGRHALVGCLFGVVWLLLDRFAVLTSAAISPLTLDVQLSALVGTRQMVGQFFWSQQFAILVALFLLVMLLLLRILLRKKWLATGSFVVFATFGLGLQVGAQNGSWLLAAIVAGLWVILLTRFGLLAMTVATFVWLLVIRVPMTADLSAWYAGSTMFVWVVIITLAGFGFYTSLAGRPLLRNATALE